MNSIRFFPNHGWLARRSLAPLLVLAVALGTGVGAFAQTADALNPPGRVAQLNYFDGPVSFEPAGYDQWAAAVLNRPLTQGDRIWNDDGARSELHVGSTAVQLSGQTSVQFSTLNDQTVQIAVTQGSVAARVRELPPGQRFEIDTPNLALTAAQPGDYRVDVDPNAGTTTVTVRSGSVQVFGSDGVPMSMPANEQISFSGNGLAQVAAQASPPEDAFGRWAAARDAAEDRAVAARYVPVAMTGYQQLDGHGTWESNPEYGEVWFPTVTVANWAPYRYGHWAYIAPWGWTWIDDQPWGFAPFHYGRWAMVGPRWCWVPGPINVRPVYAPALVAFVGGSVGGVNFRVSVGGAPQPAVGWFPLAPGEIWHPAFRASPTYVNEVNRTVIVNHHVTNITNIVNVNNRTTNVYRFQNMPRAVTAVSEKAFSQGQHLRGNFVPVSTTDLARARVVPAPAPTRDPRAIFAASRVTQPHPVPPPVAVQRHVVSNPALDHGRTGTPPVREALPGKPLRPQTPPNAVATPRGFNPAGAERAAAPAPAPMRPPAANLPREPREQAAPPRGEAIAPARPAAPQRPPQQEQAQREQAARAEQMQREQQARQQRAQQEQLQREQAAARAAQMQAQRSETAQRAQQEQQMRQTQREVQAQRARPAQEQRAPLANENRARPQPRGEPRHPAHDDKRPEQAN